MGLRNCTEGDALAPLHPKLIFFFASSSKHCIALSNRFLMCRPFWKIQFSASCMHLQKAITKRNFFLAGFIYFQFYQLEKAETYSLLFFLERWLHYLHKQSQSVLSPLPHNVDGQVKKEILEKVNHEMHRKEEAIWKNGSLYFFKRKQDSKKTKDIAKAIISERSKWIPCSSWFPFHLRQQCLLHKLVKALCENVTFLKSKE